MLILFGSLILQAKTLHKFYLSVSLLEYKPSKESIQVTIKLFLDDLEWALNHVPGVNELEIDPKNEPKNLEKIFQTYLKNNFVVLTDDERKEFEYIGKEYKGDQVIFYLEYENIDNLKTLKLTNTLLTNAIQEQQNLVHFKNGNKKKSILMDYKKNQFTHNTQ